MINFSIGPVQMSDTVRSLGARQVPYFRTRDFSAMLQENEEILVNIAKAPYGSRAIFLTGSGTASMEASVMNFFSVDDRLLVVNGGSFGSRFCRLCDIHNLNYDAIVIAPGKQLHASDLEPFESKGYTGFVVNLCETSTGVLYDLGLISEFCKRNSLFLLVDAISSFLADPIDMSSSHIDAMIVGSQKALAVPPGVSSIILSPTALERAVNAQVECMYFDLSLALLNGERGQTPFTPAVGILMQLHERLCEIDRMGAEKETERIAAQARDFRSKLKYSGLPFRLFAESPSNSVTSLYVDDMISAHEIFEVLEREYKIWVCPNGGDLEDVLFRVGHLGNLTPDDNSVLIEALSDMLSRGYFEG